MHRTFISCSSFQWIKAHLCLSPGVPVSPNGSLRFRCSGWGKISETKNFTNDFKATPLQNSCKAETWMNYWMLGNSSVNWLQGSHPLYVTLGENVKYQKFFFSQTGVLFVTLCQVGTTCGLSLPADFILKVRGQDWGLRTVEWGLRPKILTSFLETRDLHPIIGLCNQSSSLSDFSTLVCSCFQAPGPLSVSRVIGSTVWNRWFPSKILKTHQIKDDHSF